MNEVQELNKRIEDLHRKIDFICSNMDMKQKKTYTVNEAAIYLNKKPSTIRNWQSMGKLSGYREGSTRKFLEEELDLMK